MTFFISGLTLLFIYLKMTSYIDWSWLWVLSPLWISFLVAILIAIVIFSLGKKEFKCGFLVIDTTNMMLS